MFTSLNKSETKSGNEVHFQLLSGSKFHLADLPICNFYYGDSEYIVSIGLPNLFHFPEMQISESEKMFSRLSFLKISGHLFSSRKNNLNEVTLKIIRSILDD
jgi:hypothetical protein